MEQPKSIKKATSLLWIVLGISITIVLSSMIFSGFSEHEYFSSLVGMIGAAVSLGLLLFLILKISRGKNWARIFYSVLFGLNLVFWALDPDLIPSLSFIGGILTWCSTALQVYVIYLLWTKPGSLWFRSY